MSMIVIIMGKYGFIFSMVFCILFLGFCLFSLTGFCILFQLQILLLVLWLLVWVRLVSFFYFASFRCSFFSSLFIKLFVFFIHFFQLLHWNNLHCFNEIVLLSFLMHVHLFCCSCFSVVIFYQICFALFCCMFIVCWSWLIRLHICCIVSSVMSFVFIVKSVCIPLFMLYTSCSCSYVHLFFSMISNFANTFWFFVMSITFSWSFCIIV